MEFFKARPNIDFLGIRKWTAIFSVLICLASIISFFYYGLNLGLDFIGGTQIELSYENPVDVNSVRQSLKDSGFKKFEVQSFGDSRSLVVTLSNDQPVSALNKQETPGSTSNLEKKQQQAHDQLVEKLSGVIPEATINRVDYIGAKVSNELAYRGVLAVVVALFVTMLYIAFRFEYRLAISAAISLIHDPLLIMGVFSFFHITFDLTTLAGVLTILGYSLHDSIVVFDRVRENFRQMRKGTPVQVVNDAVNQTLSRTVLSSGLTLSVVVVLFLLGGPTIHAFSLALIIGIVVGTYSSIYVAGSLAVALGLRRSDLLKVARVRDEAVV
jgi:preprotein translocase subunit SecF